MLKSQRFSSLFRHYAKYHGLRKDDLEYYFVNLLENEDTPETVQLQRGDTIMVRKRRKPEPPEAAADDDEFFKDMRQLLRDVEHMDCHFVLADKTTVPAHRSVLTARGDYFKSLFRKHEDSFKEARECEIQVEPYFAENHIRDMLEFVYTNRIQSIDEVSTEDLLCVLHLSDMWCLRDAKRLIEHELIRNHISMDTVARLYGATDDYQARRLSKACVDFIMGNLRQLMSSNSAFQEEMENYPHLMMPILKAAAERLPDAGPPSKKQRTDHGTPGSGLGSAAVPDSDA